MSQAWNAKQYIDHASFVAAYGAPVLEILNPQPGERILDLGCGDGTLTLAIHQAGAAVQGVDASPSMVAATRGRGLSAEVMAGENLSFDAEFDAVFSNAALHWMPAADRVLSGVYRALKPGGRLVAELGGEGNVGALLNAMQVVFANHPEFGQFESPWYFPSPAVYGARLRQNGFAIDSLELIPRPTLLESGVKEWLKLFTAGITKNLSPAQSTAFLDEVESLVRPQLYQDGQWVADYVRLRLVARKV